MKDIILAGIQGCGKGTQAQLLLNKYWDKIAYFETWNILRALMSNDNAIGDYLKDTVNSWRLVSDNIITWLFKLFLERSLNLRKIWQTKGILHALLDKWRDPIIVLLEIPEEEVYKRLEHRKMCKECWTIYSTLTEWEITTCKKCWWELYVRTDDADINAIKTRIEEFKKETIPALEYVESLGHLVKIDWMQPIDEIFKQIEKLINA